jgi:hypothetical protein
MANNPPKAVILMGVAGSGKSAVGKGVATRLDRLFRVWGPKIEAEQIISQMTTNPRMGYCKKRIGRCLDIDSKKLIDLCHDPNRAFPVEGSDRQGWSWVRRSHPMRYGKTGKHW